MIVLSFIVAANSAIDKFDSPNLQSILEANFDLNLILSSLNIFNHCYFNIIIVPTTVSAVDLYFANFLILVQSSGINSINCSAEFHLSPVIFELIDSEG